MNFCEFWVRRPVTTVLVMAGILIFGIVAYRLLPVSTLPNVDFPTIQVSADLPGASPETMASAVATPLEKQFSTIPGIDEMSSVSSQGTTRITLQFNLGRDIDAAAQDVNSAIAATARQLPATMPAPPSFRKVNPADFPVMFLALKSSQVRLSDVDAFSNRAILPRISTLPGIAQVLIFGFAATAVGSPNSTAGVIAALFPLSSPMVMLARAAQEPDWWPHVAAIVWQMLWVALIIRTGARLFRKTVLKSGPRTKWWQRARKAAQVLEPF